MGPQAMVSSLKMPEYFFKCYENSDFSLAALQLKSPAMLVHMSEDKGQNWIAENILFCSTLSLGLFLVN